MPDDPKPADAGQGGGDGGGGDKSKPSGEVVERDEFRKVVGERDKLKGQLSAAADTLGGLRTELGGDVTVDDIKELKALRAAKAEAARKTLEEKGEYEKLLAAQREEYDKGKGELQERIERLERSLARSKMSEKVTKELVGMDVLPEAVASAEDELLKGRNGVKIQLVEDGDDWRLALRNTAGATPVDRDGNEVTIKGHLQAFKSDMPFFFKPTVKPGAGGGPSDGNAGSSQAGSDPDARLNKALEGGDQQAYAKERESLFKLSERQAPFQKQQT